MRPTVLRELFRFPRLRFMRGKGETPRGARNIGALLCALAFVVGSAPSAEAVRFHVQARLVGDGYQLITSDDEVLNRRRGHVYLGLGLYDLLGDESYNLNMQTLMRFDTILGVESEEQDRLYNFDQHQFALLHAYIEGKKLAGFLDFKVGRFTHADSLDYLMMDGAKLTFNIAPAYMAVELMAGLESKNDGNPITQNQAELDGVRFLDNKAQTANDEATIVVGGALKLINLPTTRLRFGYRRLMSGENLRVDSEKIGGAFYHNFVKQFDMHLNWSYDFYVDDLDKIQARFTIKPTEFFDIDLQYVRQLPVFDTDSIFNVFASRALNDINARFRLHLDRTHRIYLGGYVRLFGSDELDKPYEENTELIEAFGASAGWFKRFGWDGRVGVDFIYEGGFGGERVFVDASGTWAPLPRELEFDFRVTMVYFDEDLIENLNAVSGGYQLGARYMIEDKAAFMLMAEHNFSRLQSSQFRLSFVIDFNYVL